MSVSNLGAATTVVDSILFRDAFGTPGTRQIFSDRALVQRYIDVEVALAQAEARTGVIPPAAAEIIARECRLDRVDLDRMREETDIVGYPILPLVHQLVAMCGEGGATSIGAPRRRTSWTRPLHCRCAMHWTAWRSTSANCGAFSPNSRASTATHPWRAAPTCSRHCR